MLWSCNHADVTYVKVVEMVEETTNRFMSTFVLKACPPASQRKKTVIQRFARLIPSRKCTVQVRRLDLCCTCVESPFAVPLTLSPFAGLTPVTLAPSAMKMGNVVGLLDITKVFHEALDKVEHSSSASEKLYSARVQSELGTGLGANPQTAAKLTYVEALREKTALPDLTTIMGLRTQCHGWPKSNRLRCRAPHVKKDA
ncbi:hypothetical protein EDB92DRAFT_1886843 [Lactarius akahatsu]|uniref:Uncharacterized protein n=1 Tax=Lactarius akahatsu TaxID=416441 RepID=A0AAD4LER4_9AGAM|nr:hypothetical protein EDB92DRAFT_1886843 [Lactarius akahatsu]